MARPYSNLKVTISRTSFACMTAWLPGFTMAALAQNTMVAGEAKAPVTHQGNAFLEALFPILNNIALVALVGVVIFGLIWLVQRKKVEEGISAEGEPQTAEEKATAETAPAAAADATPEPKSDVESSSDKTVEADGEKSV